MGATRDPVSDEPTYGGFVLGPWWRRLSMRAVTPNGQPKRIDAANGNLLLAARTVDDQVGGFPRGFVHGMADNDYTLRARKIGIHSYLTPTAIGTCERNRVQGTWKDLQLPPHERLRLLRSPKGLPFSTYWSFCLRHGGLTGPLYAIKPYASILLSIARAAGFKR